MWVTEFMNANPGDRGLKVKGIPCTKPSYVRGLSIWRFWYLEGLLEPILHEY